MLVFLQPGASLSWDLFWQSSLFLTIGLTASLVLRRHSARAHRVLLLAIFAAIVTPLLSQVIRRGGWGLLRQPEPIVAATESPAISKSSPRELAAATRPLLLPARREVIDSPRPPEATSEAPAAVPASPTPSFSLTWREVSLGSWFLLSGLAIVRLLSGFIRGYRMIRSSRPVEDATLLQAASQAALRLGLSASPEMRRAAFLRCPSVWCWGRRPILLVPADSATTGKSIDWVAVFCHELAHWRRCDQLASLLGQLLICILPWNPLTWWAKGRLGQLAELACDDWVLANGMEGADYAASLLELLPQRGASPALAAVSSRSGLAGRVQHILGGPHGSPAIGKGWALLALVFTAVAASALAFAQAGTAPARGDPSPVSHASNDAPSKQPAAQHPALHVTVQTSDGKPVASALVLWLGSSKPALGIQALPRDDPDRRRDRIQVLARATTDDKGNARLSAEVAGGAETPTQLLVKSPGFGLGTRLFMRKPLPTEVTITLASEVPIHGRLLTPAGQPAAGVRVLLEGFHSDASKPMDEIVAASAGSRESDDELPEYWPRSLKTDADGRFTIGGVPPGVYATLSFRHPDYAVDEVTVSTVAGDTIPPGLKAFEIVPVQPTFTYTLEPARPVQGRVTDKETGKPLAGMLVEMTPMRRHGGHPFPGKTDADGRFRISGHATEFMYDTNVYPRADSGYLPSSNTHSGWPAGAKFLEVNFALEKGRLISGRVIDRDTKKPIPGAAIMYQPSQKNPNNKNMYDFRNTVLTDRDGKFSITGLPGDGLLAVEVPHPDAMRSPITGTMYHRIAYPHGSIAVNIPKQGEPKPVEITVRKGVTIEARVVDSAGAVVPDVVAFYPGISACLIDVWNQGQEFFDGGVRIQGADPGKTYRVWFLQPDRKLGTIAELKYDGNHPGPVDVRLQPTASVHGKIGGAMPQSCQIYASLVLAKDRKNLSEQELFNGDLVEFYANIVGQRHMNLLNDRPQSNGEFTLDALIPGSNFYVTAAERGGRSAQMAVPDLKPGENRDLGTLVLKERKP